MLLVTAKQMQDMDKQTIESFGIPGLVLMENAGKGSFEFLLKKYSLKELNKVVVFAGRGNNGGDGFVIARYLMEKGIEVTCLLLSQKDKVKGDAKINLDLAQKLCDQHLNCSIIEILDAKAFEAVKFKAIHCDLFIDAILGTGLNSNVRGLFKDIIEWMNESKQEIFSIDIPSGLDSDTGKPLGTCIKADATATFAFTKIGHYIYPGNTFVGDLKVIDIGIPQYIAKEKKISISVLEKDQIANCITPRNFQSHKGSYGHLLIIAGSTGKTGAASLCANTAMRSGTGLVTLGVPASINKILEPMIIETMTHPLPEKEAGYLSQNCFNEILDLMEGKQAVALGPGIGIKEQTVKLVHQLIEKSKTPLIIDADGLNCIAEDLSVLKKKKAPIILTPHPGEMSRLCNKSTADVQANRLQIATQFATSYNVTLVLKGAQTIVSTPDGHSYICPTGNPGMASGGMGDVLTGIIAAFCAQGFTPEKASIAGVYIHGLCGDILAQEMGKSGFVANDICNNIPKTIHHHLL